jgi:hypothetical protein
LPAESLDALTDQEQQDFLGRLKRSEKVHPQWRLVVFRLLEQQRINPRLLTIHESMYRRVTQMRRNIHVFKH